MLEMKAYVPTLLQRVDFELLSDPDPEFPFGVTLRPDDPMRARVQR